MNIFRTKIDLDTMYQIKMENYYNWQENWMAEELDNDDISVSYNNINSFIKLKEEKIQKLNIKNQKTKNKIKELNIKNKIKIQTKKKF